MKQHIDLGTCLRSVWSQISGLNPSEICKFCLDQKPASDIRELQPMILSRGLFGERYQDHVKAALIPHLQQLPPVHIYRQSSKCLKIKQTIEIQQALTNPFNLYRMIHCQIQFWRQFVQTVCMLQRGKSRETQREVS